MTNETGRDMARYLRTGAAAALLAFATLGLPAASGAVSPDAATGFVQTVGVRSMGILSDKSAKADDRRQRFAEVILANFDAAGIGRFVLGAHWTKASSAQQQAFLKVFDRALVKTYTDRFFDYDGNSLKVIGTQAGSLESMLIKTTVADPLRGETYKVDWMVIGSDGGEKLFDVIVDGVSTTITIRAEYQSVLAGNGGDLDKLTAALDAKLR